MKLRIGFVSIIRPLFKGDSPRAARRALAQLDALGDELGFELVTPMVTGNDSHQATGQELPAFAVSNVHAAEQAAEQLRGEALDFLFIQHTTFATGDVLVPLLHAAKRVGVWALPEASGGREATGALPLNALCGLNMTMSFLDHPEVAKREPVKWFYGEAQSEWFRERLEPTLGALRGLRAIEGARILQIGGTAPAFFGIEAKPEFASIVVETKELKELFDRIAGVPASEVRAHAAKWAERETLEVSQVGLERAARIELALRALAAEGNYHALAIRCWPELPEVCGSMACGALARLGDTNIPAACEGDVMGALSMLALQGVSGKPAILMDLSDIDGADDSLQFWHCGNAPLQWASGAERPNTRLTTHFNRDDTGVVRDMTLKPGSASGFRFLDRGGRALVVSGSFGDTSKDGFDGVRGWLSNLYWNGEPLRAEAFVANVLDYRLPHHFAFGQGELSEALVELCAWLGAEPLPRREMRHTL